MKILFLTHSFNSLAQRLFVELRRLGHEIVIEFDINDQVTLEAVELFKPRLIIAPFLKRAIPEPVWKNYCCLVVHPGIKGDRGPSALDWAILNGESEWGVTVLQATAEMDGGPIWSSRTFPMRQASKGSLYRNEVTNAAVAAVIEALGKVDQPGFAPETLDYRQAGIRGCFHPLMQQCERTIDWPKDNAEQVAAKIRSADGSPGVLDNVLGMECYLYNACIDMGLKGPPGQVIAQRNGAIGIATRAGGVWVSHLQRRLEAGRDIKLPAYLVLGDRLAGIPEQAGVSQFGFNFEPHHGIAYSEEKGVGYLSFNFYNGAMSTRQCLDLLDAYRIIKERRTRVLVLLGGTDFWSNGIDLNTIEASDCPAEESFANINALNSFVRELILTESQLTIAALQGNAGAGGVFMALACDEVWARSGIILNPHYKNIGNLYGSEYWTYLLPRRIGSEKAEQLMGNRLPLGTVEALHEGLIDDSFGETPEAFLLALKERATRLAAAPELKKKLAAKHTNREHDEARKPLDTYRLEEMERMNLNFFGFDPSYHVARYNFVHKIPKSHTPLHLAIHRQK